MFARRRSFASIVFSAPVVGRGERRGPAGRLRPLAAGSLALLWALLGALLGAIGGCSDAPERQEGLFGAVLITLDTTRATALGAYGAPPEVTPHLDRLAREALVYDAARTVAPLTLPAHASMLTGLYPPRHSVRDNGLWALPQEALTLAESARAAGFETAAFIAAAVLGSAYGLDQGFDVYDEVRSDVGDESVHMAERPASEVAEALRAWLDARDATRPFFLWMHLFDPHAPYEPPPRFLEQVGGKAYRGEVAAADDAVGTLVAALREHALLDRVLLIVVADHGEDLGQHGEATHSVLCYDTVMRVPLLIRYPDGHRAGERSAALASVVDVHATIADALGLEVEPGLDGESLYRRSPSAERGVYFESYCGYLNYGWSPITGWADARGKYLHGPQPEFYAPGDTLERRNLAPESDDLEHYRTQIARVAARPALARDALDPDDAGRLAELRALGYAGAGDADAVLPAPLEDTGLPAPRTRMDELDRFYAAVLAGGRGELDPAISALEELVATNPLNRSALDFLGIFLRRAGRPADAAAVLERLLALGPERMEQHYHLGQCYEDLGRLDDARTAYRRALELQPDDEQVRASVARLEAALVPAR